MTPPRSDVEVLRPCPFCGGEAHLERTGHVTQAEQNATAIAAWNRRAAIGERGEPWRPIAEISELAPVDQPEALLYFPPTKKHPRPMVRVGRPCDFPRHAALYQPIALPTPPQPNEEKGNEM